MNLGTHQNVHLIEPISDPVPHPVSDETTGTPVEPRALTFGELLIEQRLVEHRLTGR